MSDNSHRSVGNKIGNLNVILRVSRKRLRKTFRTVTQQRWFPGTLCWSIILLTIYLASRVLPLQ